jgi:hypothetical protein
VAPVLTPYGFYVYSGVLVFDGLEENSSSPYYLNDEYFLGDYGPGPVKGAVVCVPYTTNRTAPVYWKTGMPAQKLGDIANYPNRQCGLINIGYTTYTDATLFAESTDSVQVFQGPDGWYLGGTGNAAGGARCVDIPGTVTDWWYEAGTGVGTYRMDDAYYYDTCFLTGVQGNFRNPSWNDEVWVSQDGMAHWQMSLDNGKIGMATCIY